MREELGKALYWVGYEARVREEDRLTPDLAWKRCGPEQRTFNLAQVDAILAALSEPSEAMLAAASEAALDGITGYQTKPGVYEMHTSPKAYWQAMLKAAGEE